MAEPRVVAPLLAMNRGEVSKLALARVDVEQMRMAAQCQLNWLPWVIGAMELRPGLGYVSRVYGDSACRILPFIFSKTDTALIELTSSKMRVLVGDELVTRVAVSTVIGDSNFSGSGSWVTTGTTAGCTTTITGGAMTLTATAVSGLAQAKQTIGISSPDQSREHGVRFVVTNGPVTVRVGTADGLDDLVRSTSLDTGTHSLTFVPGVANVYLQVESTDAWKKTLSSISIDSAGVLEVPTPWVEQDLPTLRSSYSGDIIYVACYGKQQYKIERRDINAWSVVLYRSDTGPFQEVPQIAANFTPGDYYGNTTLTSDRPYFTEDHVGTTFRLFVGGQTNKVVLGGKNAFSKPVRVSGVGTSARNYSWTVSGTWAGTLTIQRSFDGPDTGFTDVATVTSNGTTAVNTGGSGGSPNLDNVISWERIGFKGSDYTSGAATVQSTYAGGGGYARVRVTGYTSPTQVSIEVLLPFTSLNATTDWQQSDWSAIDGWPTSVAFYEGRLWWFGRDKQWGSQSNNYTGYAKTDDDGLTLGDAGAITESFGEGPVDSVNWGLPLMRLLCGREQSIASIRSSSFDTPLTPTNYAVKDCSQEGAARLPAIKVGKRGLFVQQSGRRVYELSFNLQEYDYSDKDLTRLNIDIGKTGFTDIALQVQPDKMVWLPRGDGQCAALLYDPQDEVECWWRMQTLGIIEQVAVLPEDGLEDRVYFVVQRLIDGTPRRFIEKMALRDDCVGGLTNDLLDSYYKYSGSPVTALTVSHLPNTVVSVWADGAFIGTTTTNASGQFTMPDGQAHSNVVAGLTGEIKTYSGDPVSSWTNLSSAYNGLTAEVFADQQPSGRMVHVGSVVVEDGTIQLPNGLRSSNIVAFFGYMAPFLSAKLAYAVQGDMPLSQKQTIDHVGLMLYDTHANGIRFGQEFSSTDGLPEVEGDDSVDSDTVWQEYDEPSISVPGKWETGSRLALLAQAPFPVKVGGVSIALTTQRS